MILELLSNIALVVALSVVIQAVEREWGLDTLVAKLLSGVLFALVTIVAMSTPVVLDSGLIFDGRSIILCTAGVLGGPLVASIAAVAAGVYRAYIGGVGVTMGVSVVAEAAVLGSVFYYLRRRDKRFESLPYLLGLGVVVHVIMVLLMWTLPESARALSLSRVAAPVLVLYPLGTVAVCKLLLENEERMEVRKSLERSEASLRASNERLERMTAQLAASFTSIISVVGEVVETRDPYTAGHERRVAELSVRIAEEMGMPMDRTEEIRIAGLIHDVGKISVPTEILSKPGRLTPIEFELIKGHAEAGYTILSSANMDAGITEMVRQHHERCDGSGYPRGLTGAEILAGAKVLMVADVVEAMVSHRPYRAGLGVEPALAEIERGAGEQYDEDVVAACLTCFRERGFEFTPV